MAISKENLGVVVEEIKISNDESYSSKADLDILLNKVDDINIAQKTVNSRGIKELLDSERIININSASTVNTAVSTTVDAIINLNDSIENYDLINIQVSIKTTERYYKSDAFQISASQIVYNNTNTFNAVDGSVLRVAIDLDSTIANGGGGIHTFVLCWFKDATTLFIKNIINPQPAAAFNKVGISSVQGIKLDSITIDPVEYVNTTQGIEDAPVGSIISFMGNTPPKHYLNCDGSVYNITEYPYLSQFIKDQFGSFNFFGGDGIDTFAVPADNLSLTDIDVTPVMTSNNSPSPYVVSASSEYSSHSPAWKAFNNRNNLDSGLDSSANDCWVAKTAPPTWIKIDLSKKTPISKFKISSRNSSNGAGSTQAPKSFTIQGSNDDTTFIDIKTFTNQPTWGIGEARMFELDNIVNYRYYRLTISATYGDVSSIGELKLLMKNTTFSCIKYEPTYFMNIQGLVEETTLWEGKIGNASSTQEYNTTLLTDSIKNYDKLIFRYQSLQDNRWYWQETELTIDVLSSYIETKNTNEILSLVFGYRNSDAYMSLKNATSTDNKLDWEYKMTFISKIIGIKYKTFQNNPEGGN